jgi:uncharacterized protein
MRETRQGSITIREAHFPGRAGLDAYGNGGFRFAGMSHRGSILCLPSGIHGWSPATVADLDRDAFAPIIAEAGAIEFLLIGTGPDIVYLDDDLRAAFREAGVRIEVMSTGAAVRTYNVMLSEDRPVAAALLAVD